MARIIVDEKVCKGCSCLLYTSEDRDQVRSAVGDLLAIVCSVAAPGRCALYGDCLLYTSRCV